jgi:hypothetical protein
MAQFPRYPGTGFSFNVRGIAPYWRVCGMPPIDLPLDDLKAVIAYVERVK